MRASLAPFMLCCVGVLSLSDVEKAEESDTFDREMVLDVGDEVHLIMPNGKWTRGECQWRSRFTYSFDKNDDLDQDQDDIDVQGRRYKHSGRDDECGLWLSAAVDEDDGVWVGHANRGASNDFVYRINVVIRAKPTGVEMDASGLDDESRTLRIVLDENNSDDQNSVDIECVVKGGRPQPTAQWNMDGFSLDTSDRINVNYDQEHTLTSSFHFLARPSMDGKRLRCSVRHSMLSSDLVDDINLEIEGYPDREVLSSSYKDDSFTVGESNEVRLRIFSKPAPKYVVWQDLPGLNEELVVFKEDNFDESEMEQLEGGEEDNEEGDEVIALRDATQIDQTDQVEKGRYTASIKSTSDEHVFEVALRLAAFEESDLDRTFELLAYNDYGRALYDVRFIEPEAKGLQWWVVVLILLGIVVVLGGAAVGAGFLFVTLKRRREESALPPASNSRVATYTHNIEEPMASINEMGERGPEDNLSEEQL